VRNALQAVAYYQTEKNKPLSERSGGIRDHPDVFIKKGVIDRLIDARRLTPDDARIHVQLAWGTNILWELSQRKSVRELPIAENAIRFGMKATQLDPRGAAGYLVQYQIRLIYAQINEGSAEDLRKKHGDPVLINEREYTAREQYKLAAKTLEDYLPNDPHDTALHYDLWRAWSKAGDKEKAREHANEALRLDDLVTMPARKLTDLQRKQLDEWRSTTSSQR
jgi:tetratricopeptide (TPR) repeat protein